MKLKDYFKKAQKQKWAIAQFNFSTLEQLRAIFETAKEEDCPVILGTSEGESRFLGLEEISTLTKIYRKKYGVSAFLNLDHGKDIEWLKAAVDIGYDAIHFDGSGLSLEENMEISRNMARYAHKKGALLEGELGCITGESVQHEGVPEIEEKNLTRPNDVKIYLKKSNVDSLAVSIGNIHGLYLAKPRLDFARLDEINKDINAFLVLHGGSGIPDEEIKNAVSRGIVKVNFNTEIRLVWKESLLKAFQDVPNDIKPYKILSQVQTAIKKKVAEKINLLNCKNKL